MSRRSKPITRLSVIFILAIILSGGVLTYFSINNISNLKELTEKKILEEQRELSARFSTALQKQIEELTSGFKQDVDQAGLMIDSMRQTAAGSDFILQAFILNSKGQFIYPGFTGILEDPLQPVLSDRFKSAFEQGEYAEFSEKDPRKAKEHYRSCLRYAAGENDSVIALNALGRISIKSGQPGDAAAIYSIIIQDYFSLLDRNGFPYAYYALSHLLTSTTSENYENTIPVIESLLDKMARGSVPLNFFTKDLLTQAKAWVNDSTKMAPGNSSNINSLITHLNQQIQFVDQYGNELADLVIHGKSDKQYRDSNGFKIVDPLSGTKQELFLIHTGDMNSSGYFVDRNGLFETISNTGIEDGLEFEYVLEFPSGYISNTSAHSLSYSAQLNPYFPGQIIHIRIANENLISDLIKRRSWIYGIASALLLLAMFLGVILILRDIAREKKLATIRSDFISNVTHELKTPLTSIRMYAESLMMKRVKAEPGQTKYLSVIVNESERLTRMINNILEFSKMEKAKQEYHPVESNLSEILDAAIGDMNYWLEKKGFKMTTEIEQNVKVKVDPEKFYQVYSNLLSNAIKYSGDSKNIRVRLHKNSGSVITEVEDEGIGIENENLTRIFEEFFRVESNESGNITGTGLGLTVVKEIVEAHQGKIMVQSEIGKGSKFSVILFQQ